MPGQTGSRRYCFWAARLLIAVGMAAASHPSVIADEPTPAAPAVAPTEGEPTPAAVEGPAPAEPAALEPVPTTSEPDATTAQSAAEPSPAEPNSAAESASAATGESTPAPGEPVRPALADEGTGAASATAQPARPNAPATLTPPTQAKPVLAEPRDATSRRSATSRDHVDEGASGAPTAAATALTPASFNGVRPGETSESKLLSAWGRPFESSTIENQTRYYFRIRPFAKVEATVTAGQVVSLAIHLGTAIEPQTIARQLELNLDEAATVHDDAGQPLGLAFPERGVLFSFAPKPGQPRVLLVMLDPIDAQPFLARAEGRLRSAPSAALADLELAISLDPLYAHAWWTKARLLLELGRNAEALAAANEALRLEPTAPQYRLTRAAALAATGKHAEALTECDGVLAVEPLEPMVRGHALKVRGDLAAAGPGRDPQQALSFHSQAIKKVDPLGLDQRPAVRRAAKELLLELHLAVAADVAWGNWRDKPKVVPKWLERAAAFADDLEQVEDVDLPLRLMVARWALAANVGVQGRLNVARWLARGQEEAELRLAKATDPGQRAELRWQLALLLYDALQSEHARGNVGEADRQGQKLIETVAALEAPWRPEGSDYLLGRTYFRLGAAHAVHKNEHAEAVKWYDKARPLLEKPSAGLPLADHAPRGEDFVSMGVSYWEANQRELAVTLTRQGIELLQTGARDQHIEPTALAVPYGNLATMLETLGQREESKRFAELAAGSRETKTR